MKIHGEQAYVFRFTHEEDRTRVLEIGSVHIVSKLFLIRPWTPFIEQQIESIKTVPIWMILRGVPLHLWNASGFSKIASLVGKPILTDAPTALKTRLAFARIYVEVDADCKYPTKLPFRLDDKKYEVRAEYAWKPSSCFHCKTFGHLGHNCSSNKNPKLSKALPNVPSSVADPIPMINGTSKEVEEGTEVGGKTSIPLATGEATLVVSQLDVVDASKQWKTFFKRKKNVGRKEYLMQAPTCSSNSFEALSEEQERVRVEDRHIDTENREVGIEEEEFTNEDGNSSEEVPVEGEIVIQVNPNNILNSELPFPIFSGDENGMEVDALKDDNESVKTHGVESVLKDNPIRALESSTQNVNALIKFSALLGAPRGGSEKQRKDMFTELALEYQNRNPVVEKSRKAPKIEK